MAIEINARKRETQGTGAARRLRRLGRVPGIVYGGDKDAVNIELDHQDLVLNLRNERFHASILTLELAGIPLDEYPQSDAHLLAQGSWRPEVWR